LTDEFTTYDAAYLLGSLTSQDRAAYEAHLAECPDCRHAVNQLAGLPGLLAAVPAERARTAGDAGPGLPDTLLPRLLAEVQRSRFRRRWTNALVGAAAAAVLAVVVAAGLHNLSSTDPSPPGLPNTSVVRHLVPVSPDIPVTATARLADEPYGTLITVRCTYRGHPEPQAPGNGAVTYTMVVVDKSGHSQQIAGWAAIPGQPAVIDGSTSVPHAQIASVRILGPGRRLLLTLQL